MALLDPNTRRKAHGIGSMPTAMDPSSSTLSIPSTWAYPRDRLRELLRLIITAMAFEPPMNANRRKWEGSAGGPDIGVVFRPL
jgi:hypothetical protein